MRASPARPDEWARTGQSHARDTQQTTTPRHQRSTPGTNVARLNYNPQTPAAGRANVITETKPVIHGRGKPVAAMHNYNTRANRDEAERALVENVRPWDERDVKIAQAGRHHFEMMISPEAGERIDRHPGGMARYVEQTMQAIERELQRAGIIEGRLDWTASIHRDTHHPHAHVIVRDEDDKGVGIYLQFKVRLQLVDIARDEATRMIGPYTELERQTDRWEQVRSPRLTHLDRELLEHQERNGGRIARSGEGLDAQQAERLRSLDTMGHVTQTRDGYRVTPDLKERLTGRTPEHAKAKSKDRDHER